MTTSAMKKNWDIDSIVNYVSEIVAKESGNVLGDNQKSMVANRLNKRMIDLGGYSPEQYYQHLIENYDREATYLISLLTTHHTFFFREFCHFEYMVTSLDSIVERVKKRGSSKIRILSAACSRGQEVYSLAMFFNEHLKKYPEMDYEILGTDIDPQSIQIGANGVYPYNEVKSIPQLYLNGNWQRGTGDIARFAKVKEHLKKKCSFKVMNLLSPESTLGNSQFDIILCRNVFIYFELSDVKKIVLNFKKFLYKDALFVTGLSESLKSIDLYKQTFAPSVYSFDEPEVIDSVGEKVSNVIESAPISYVPSRKQTVIPKPIKMLVVDDSNSIVKLLSKVFSSDPDFELVGTATNGIEAREFLKNNEVDAMTLDIHMPEMDGVTYLKENFNESHPKVVVVSSASREDSRYAQETLKNGASDFVEKPALNNITERAAEIKNKIKMSFLNSSFDNSSLDKSFEKKYVINSPDTKARALVASYSDLKKVTAVINDFEGDQPPCFIFFEGNKNFLEIIKDELKDIKNVEVFNKESSPKKNTIYLCDFKTDFDSIGEIYKWQRVSLSIFGIASEVLEKKIIDLKIGQVLLEDNDDINKDFKEIVTDIFPWTSFPHVATEFLSKID